ncbi:piggyBac transposable element-derived protein 4-like [Ptychodera flava]|uniref:piggyBac transposable element-derived protein 4-like n=1 Tax=Ptychodera flava TaxID=63121 RepID=UPI00396A100F
MSSESDVSDALDLQAPSDTDSEGEEFDRRPPNPWFRVFPPEPARDHVIFQEATGPVRPPSRDASPLAYFELFFTIELVRSFVIETNRYAASFIERNHRALGHASRVWRWIRAGGTTTVSEIKAFVAIILDMGLIQKNRIADYWEVKYRSQSTPWFRKIFSRNRFQLLLKFFHIVDNRAIPDRGEVGHDPRNKFQNLIDHCNRKFKQHYKPREMLSIDESMVGSRNRCDLIQFMPNKHHHSLA